MKKAEKWYVAAKKADFEAIGEKFHIDPVIARIIRNRDIVEEAEIEKFLYGAGETLYPPEQMKGIVEAAALLKEKLAEKKPVRIIGDYDVDGIVSTYILEKGLKVLGGVADTAIPHRIQDGYGLNEGLIEDAKRAGVDTILTCDNGIAAYEPVSTAIKNDITVIITDHHEVPFEETEDGGKRYILPPAQVVVNPRQPGCAYPFSGICGAVVAYKLIQALYTLMGKEEAAVLEECRELAAFATICDVMELVDENRILVKQGLQSMQHTKNTGLGALMEVSGLSGKEISSFHVGFVLGPCLNATGRLDTAKRALELLNCEKREEALMIAADLKSLNDSRKEMTVKGVKQAVEKIEAQGLDKKKVMVVYLENCHESIAGIIAGRVRERFGKPVFILTDGEEGLKGSGRSIEAYHMYEEMSRCKELFTKYGGHKMAAGLSLPRENAGAFAEKINALCTLTEEDFVEKIHIDVPMPFSYVNRKLVEQLALLEPFGMGNPKPLFAQKDVTFVGGRVFGKNKNVGKYTVMDGNGGRFLLTYFGDLDAFHEYLKEKQTVSVIYYPSLNTYRGKTEIQFVMQNYR